MPQTGFAPSSLESSIHPIVMLITTICFLEMISCLCLFTSVFMAHLLFSTRLFLLFFRSSLEPAHVVPCNIFFVMK